jgi:hypothetical protein
MVKYEVRFNDGEHFADAHTLQEAKEIRSNNNFRFMSRSLHIYEITTHGGWNENKIV